MINYIVAVKPYWLCVVVWHCFQNHKNTSYSKETSWPYSDLDPGTAKTIIACSESCHGQVPWENVTCGVD